MNIDDLLLHPDRKTIIELNIGIKIDYLQNELIMFVYYLGERHNITKIYIKIIHIIPFISKHMFVKYKGYFIL